MSFWRNLLGKQTTPSPNVPTPPPPPQQSAPPTAAEPPKQAGRLLVSHFLYQERPRFDHDRLQAALTQYLPESRILTVTDDLVMIGHEDLPLPTSDDPGKGKIPAQTYVMLPGAEGLAVPNIDHMLQQTHGWPEAREAVAKTRFSVFVNECLCLHVDLRSRLRIFHGVHRALIDVAPPLAVYSRSAEHVINPAELSKPLSERLDEDPSPLFLNVRFFNIANRGPGEILVDSRGLAELDLPDVQMHVRGMQPNDVFRKVYSIAGYILQNGDCIDNGHTVQGFDPAQKWRCQHEDALISPPRVVLDIDPGAPFAAGERKPATT